MLLMGGSLLLLLIDSSVGMLVLVLFVFVVGEMLWVPTSQAVVAAFAPDDLRGAYMGAFGGASQVAWAVTPFAGLQVRHAFGDAAMWAAVAGLSVVAAAGGAAAAARRAERPALASARA